MEVSVIIPNYNRTQALKRAIKSVLNQTYQDFEIIIVDDASSLDPQPIIDSINATRIYLHRHSINKNAAAARNTGARLARGIYLAFLDSDDEWLPNHLERRITLIEKEQSDGIYGAVSIEKNGAFTALPLIRQVAAEEHMLDYLLSNACRAQTSTLFISKEAFSHIQFDESLAQNQDYDFNIRFHQNYRYVCDPVPTVIVHLSGADRMGKKIKHDSCFRFIDKHRTDIPTATYYNYLLSMLKTTLVIEGRSMNALRYLIRIIITFPDLRRVLRAIHLVIPVLKPFRQKPVHAA